MQLRELGENRRKLLCDSFLLAGAAASAAEALLHQAYTAAFAKGQAVAAATPYHYFGLLLHGRASAYSHSGALLRGFAKGDMFGLSTLYAADGEPLPRIVADSAAEALFLPQQNLRQLLQSDWQVAENYIRFLGQRISFLNRKITALTAGSTSRKLAAYLARHHQHDQAGHTVADINLSKLAQTLDISRASLYRSLTQLAEAGLLHRQERRIVIHDIQALAAYAHHTAAEAPPSTV